MPSSSHSDAPDVVALGLEEREAHRAADEHGVGALQEGLEHADLVGDLRAADDRHERAGRVLEDARERLDLALEQQPGGVRQQLGDAHGRGVRAVRGAERVVHVDVGQRGVALRQLGVVLGLPRLVADVLEHHELGVGDVVEVGGEHDVGAEQLAEVLGDGLQRQLGLAVLRPAEVRREHDARGAALAQRRDGRQRRADPRVVGDVLRVVERDVEVDPQEDALALDVEVLERPHVRGASGAGRRSGSSSPTRCRTRTRP